mmetsp:Transcript_9430/g.18959  ORF Transcript_9430/g.18959 Transcript_9430/m.18959 type:complete len:496 (+) Transcript_9430:86-1573(+)
MTMMLSEKNRNRANDSSTELQHLLDKYCFEIELPSYPPTRTQSSTSLPRGVGDDQEAAAVSWTQQDTENALQNLPHDVHLGVKLYHTNPIHRIHTACQSSSKLFIDHEFCVAEGSEVRIREEICTPGIITPQNVEDFVNSGEPKRVARIDHFTSKARRSTNTTASVWTWKRGSSMPGKKIFSSSPKAQNVVQGKVGNCGFCSGFASLAAHFPNIIENAFLGTVENKIMEAVGAISVRIYPGGKERFILLDDYLLCLTDSSTSPALHSLDENDLWIRILEKIFVKLQSSYASLDGYYKYNSLYRHPARALQLISNAPIALELHYTVQQVDEVYNTLLSTETKYILVAHGRKAVEGLFRGHGYSLLWVGEIAGIRLVLLRNPHGNKSYTGEFGRGCDSWSSSDAISVENELENNMTTKSLDTVRSLFLSTKGDNDDGIFLMRFGVFVECFPITTVIGPISEKGEPVVLDGFVVKDSLYRLPIEQLKVAESLFEVAER